ncbi:MAG: hypothetical protein N2376_06590 [Clostridia bacterium]|nr:hypothetical protein [Clostridia bacterium]
MPERFLKPVLFVLLFVVGSLILFYPPTIGLADNSDFGRVLLPEGIKTDNSLKYFYFEERFGYSSSSLNPLRYGSTLTPVIMLAKALNNTFSRLFLGSSSFFDIRMLGMLYLLLHCLTLVFLYGGLKSRHKWANLITFAKAILKRGGQSALAAHLSWQLLSPRQFRDYEVFPYEHDHSHPACGLFL